MKSIFLEIICGEMFTYKDIPYYIATTRFNTDTWTQNMVYKKKHNINGVVYGTSTPIVHTIPRNQVIFVIEMLNLSSNEKHFPGMITGISIIRNRYSVESKRIYHDHNYNRYIYSGKYYFPREIFNEKQISMITKIEEQLFYGKTHCKRGKGISKLPRHIYENNKPFLVFLMYLYIKEKYKNRYYG